MKYLIVIGLLCFLISPAVTQAFDFSFLDELQNKTTFNGQIPLEANVITSVNIGNKNVVAREAPIILNDGRCITFVDTKDVYYFHCGEFTVKEIR